MSDNSRTDARDGRGDSGGESGEPITVLLVDDDPDCRMLVRDAIAECRAGDDPHAVREARNGVEALALLRASVEGPGRSPPGLIYLDVEMPGMDGLETLARIRADERLRDVPVVMMTGVACDAHMRRAAALGANSYTLKPADAVEFLRTVAASTDYWLNVHQYPDHHAPQGACRR